MNKEQVNSFNINNIEEYNNKKEINKIEKTLKIKPQKKIISKSNIKTNESNNIKNNILNKIDVPPFKVNEKEASKMIKEKEIIKQKNEDNKNEEKESIIQKEKQPQRKKEWKSWSSQEKLMFYELIANGGNYSSLQKLFKTMNDVRIKNIILNIKYFLNIKY